MSRSVWLKADGDVGDWDARRRRITAGLEAGVDWVVVDPGDVERVRELGDVRVASLGAHDDADAVLAGGANEGVLDGELLDDVAAGADGAYVHVRGEEYEALAAQAAADAEYTVVVGEDWQIIPLENLIARVGEETTLVAGAESAEEARTAFETLELGADGVLLDSDDPDEIRGAVEERDAAERESLELRYATVTDVERVGSADRVCVDTGSMLDHDEGMLVGSTSRGLFFVHAETAESPYVAARPFRVNAGAVHAYVRVPGGETRYLAELDSGDDVLVVDRDGDTREAVVGRVKIEQRPMFRVEAEVETDDGADRVQTLLQNAETVKMATPDGRTAVTDLAAGDEVALLYEATARHFGEAVEETIVEK